MLSSDSHPHRRIRLRMVDIQVQQSYLTEYAFAQLLRRKRSGTMDAAQLVQVEALCETLYNSADETARSHAQNQLLSLQTSAERIPQCQYILDNSENAYALLLASSSLTRLISNHWNNFTTPQRVEIRNYILNYLFSVGPGLTDYVRTSLIQLLCRITKLGWFDDQRHREVVDAVMMFLQVLLLYSVCMVCKC